MLISFLAGIIAIEILYFREGEPVWPIFLKIIILSINIRAGIFYNFPSLMGYDAYWHAKIAQLITNTSFVPPFEISTKYFYYPIFHIFVSITQLINEINIKDAIFCSIGLVSIISTIFIYFIGKKLGGAQVGLLAILLANITYDLIVRGITNVTPGSLVLCYFMLILYLIFKEKHKLISRSLIMFMTLLMITTHQLSTFVVFVSLVSIYLGKEVYNSLYKSRESIGVRIPYILLFAVALQSYWMHTYVSPGRSFFNAVVGPLIEVLHSGSEYGHNILIVGYEYHTLFDTLLLHSSYLILPFFAIGGTLFWLSVRDNKKFSIVTIIIILYFFVYIIPMFGIRNMLTSRWMPLLSVFLVIIVSAYILEIIELIKSNRNKVFAIFTIVAIFSFLMIVTPGINKDNPIVAKDTTVRNQFKESEICAAKTIINMDPKQIRLDTPFFSCFLYGINISSEQLIRLRTSIKIFDTDYITSNIQEEKETMIILRKCTLNEPIYVKTSKFYETPEAQLLSEEFFDRFESTGYDLVYDNGEILGYISR